MPIAPRRLPSTRQWLAVAPMCTLLCALMGPPMALAAAPATQAVQAAHEQQAQIAAERAAIKARFDHERAGCTKRFAVNACLDDATQRERRELAPLRAREQTLDAEQRQQRSAERQAALAERQALRGASAAQRSARGEAAASAAGAAKPSRPPGQGHESRANDAAAKAAERAAAARKMQDDIRADQARIDARLAKRAAQGKKVPPLPAVASAPR